MNGTLVKNENILDADFAVIEEVKEPTISTSTELVVANDNMLPAFPDNIHEIATYLAISEKAIEAEEKLLKSLNGDHEKYFNALKKTQNHASQLLFAQYTIGQQLKEIKKHQGTRNDLKVKDPASQNDFNQPLTKKETIEKVYKLTPRQARDFQNLSIEGIKKAIEEAANNNDIPTRSMALSFKPIEEKDAHQSFQFDTIYTEKDQPNAPDINFDDGKGTNDEHNKSNEIKYTSLFANVGIGTYYLKDMNINCTVANELLKDRAEWHKAIYPQCQMIVGDLHDEQIFKQLVDAHIKNGCQMVLASPPCQTFSKANTSNNKAKDPRSSLILDTLNFIEATNPKYVMIENVPEFLTCIPLQMENDLQDNTIGNFIKNILEQLGYCVNIGVINAADYGTPQSRNRAIILACKKELGIWSFPKKDKFQKMLFEAIGDLPSLEPGEHNPKDLCTMLLMYRNVK